MNLSTAAKRTYLLSLVIIGVLVTSPHARSDVATETIKKARCPISGKPCDPEVSAKYREGLVYFCCPECVAEFESNTNAHATKANHQLAVTGQYYQRQCPVSGAEMEVGRFIEIQGVDVHFCSAQCQASTEGDADACLEAVFADEAFETTFEKTPDHEQE